jgi:hypothetical protein
MGSQKSQCRNAQAVTNHLNFCMMATTLTWIYADRLKTNPERRHKVKGRTSFAFSDVRRIIAETALDPASLVKLLRPCWQRLFSMRIPHPAKSNRPALQLLLSCLSAIGSH